MSCLLSSGVTVDPSYDAVDLVQIAMGACRMAHKVAASHYGVSAGEWSRIMARTRPLDLGRLWGFPADWWREFAALLAARHGLHVTTPEQHEPVQALLRAVAEIQAQYGPR